MKYHFTISRFIYAIDEHQNRYELRPFIRGIIGALAAALSITSAWAVSDCFPKKSFLSVLLSGIIIVAVYLAVTLILDYILLILARHGCKGLFEMNHEDNSADPGDGSDD